MTFQEYLQQLKEFQQWLEILEQEIEEHAKEGVHAPINQTLMTLRGVAVITATSWLQKLDHSNVFRLPNYLYSY